MKKSAQSPESYPNLISDVPSQYGYGSYDTSMDNMGFLPGISPQLPEENKTPSWLLPLGLTAGALTGYALLRGAGKGVRGMLGKLRSPVVPKPVREPWNWEMEMLGREGPSKFQHGVASDQVMGNRYTSILHPGQPVGHGYGPPAEATVKQSNLNPSLFSHVIIKLGQLARKP